MFCFELDSLKQAALLIHGQLISYTGMVCLYFLSHLKSILPVGEKLKWQL